MTTVDYTRSWLLIAGLFPFLFTIPIAFAAFAAFASPSTAHPQTTTTTVVSMAVSSNPGADNASSKGNPITASLKFSEVVADKAAPSDSGESVASEAPVPPVGLGVVRYESGKLKASWEAPASGPSPTGYTVQWKESSADWTDPEAVSEARTSETSHVIEELTDGVEYTVRVATRTDHAESVHSVEIPATPQETVPPSLSAASVDGAALELTFNEALDSAIAPDRTAFTVLVADSSRGVDTVTIAGSAVTITLVTAVSADDLVMVDYTAPADSSASKVKDLHGNAAVSFSAQEVSNNTQTAEPLTAAADGVPASHDGSATFTFELEFSQELWTGFSYKTMRDHAFAVTGGSVVDVRRLHPPDNDEWEIHVQPDGNGDVTITLPVTTDCTADRAICTEDRLPLSSQLELTVGGPGTPSSAPVTGTPATATEPTPTPEPGDDTGQSRGSQDSRDSQGGDQCPNPTPIEIAVTSVPIQVPSTTSHYFVLYANLDGTEIPVQVKRGEDGTTTLEENIKALPASDYRVEKYEVSDPGDVDGDCLNDLTDPWPLNHSHRVDLDPADGTMVIEDVDHFWQLAQSGGIVKFTILELDSSTPELYFQNTNTHSSHLPFLNLLGVDVYSNFWDRGRLFYDGSIYRNGKRGVFRYSMGNNYDATLTSSGMKRLHTLLAANMPLVDHNLAFRASPNTNLPDDWIQSEDPRVPILLGQFLYRDVTYKGLNTGEGYGRLQALEPTTGQIPVTS